MTPKIPVQAIASLVDYNWHDEQDDYNTEALVEDNSREGHIFEALMEIQRWLEIAHRYPHIEPLIMPDDREPEPEPVRVIFRKFRSKRDGQDIIALFPDLPGSNDPATCLSYMHTGQHGQADLLGLMYQMTRPATPDEYAALKQELEAAPYEYRLTVIQRTPKDSAEHRAEAIRPTTSGRPRDRRQQ